ncbi:MAG: SurA N-terminal domain-containing protein [Sphingomonadales bacterium]
MLSIFRNFSKSPIGIGIFALILIAFVVTLYEGKSGLGGMSLGGSGAIVQVGSLSIDEAELTRRLQNQLEGARQQTPTLTMAQFIAAGGMEQTISLTATGRALELFAEQEGMVASKKLVDGAIASIPAFNGPTGKFDPVTFQQVLSQRKISEVMLRADFAREALTKALAIPIAGAARVPVGMVQPYASLLLEAREGRVAEVPSRVFLPTAAPNDAEVQSFYQRNLARYTVPERRVIRYATFDKSRVADKAQATDAEIQAVYTAQAAEYGAREKRSFTQLIIPTEAQANELLAKIRGGMSLVDAAKSVKRDPIPVASTDATAFGKLTGPDVATAAFATPKGEYAAIKRSGLGYHIVRVDGVQTIAATPLSAVRAKLAAEISAQKESRAVADYVAEMEDAAGSGLTFDELAKKYALTGESTPPLTTSGAAIDTAGYKAPVAVGTVLAAAFQADVGDEPSVTALPQDAGYVVWKLDRTIPAAPKPLADVRAQVIADVQTNKGALAAKIAAEKIVAAVNGGTPLDVALKGASVALPAPAPAKALRIQLVQAKEQVPPPLALLFQLPEKRARVLEMPAGGGWYVVVADKVIPGDVAKAPAGLIEATREQLSSVVGDEYVQQFASAVRAKIGVSTNASAVSKLKQTLLGGSGQ